MFSDLNYNGLTPPVETDGRYGFPLGLTHEQWGKLDEANASSITNALDRCVTEIAKAQKGDPNAEPFTHIDVRQYWDEYFSSEEAPAKACKTTATITIVPPTIE